MPLETDPQFSPQELLEIDRRLLSGVVSRAGILSLVFCPVFTIYAYTSLDFLHLFNPNLTLLDNLWPRLLCNTIPTLLIGLYLRNYTKNVAVKAWIWAVGMPIIFAMACMVHVWPLIWQGKLQLYSYVHAANLFIITTTLIVVSPVPKILWVQVASFAVFFLVPIVALLSRDPDGRLLKWAMNDYAIAFAVSIYASMMVHKLRHRIACYDFATKKAAGAFLGSTLSEAIYSQSVNELHNRRCEALIVKIDIRGYTDFYKKNDIDFVGQFMSAYHNIVSRNINTTGGYWHKSIGDGQLASYGAMDKEPDLSEIPGLEKEMASATERKTKGHFSDILRASMKIAYEFERLKEKFDLQDDLSLGIAIARGEVAIRVQGDDQKKELDIDGEVILRCSRLEAYTKVLQNELKTKASVFILSAELMELADPRMFSVWSISSERIQVRNYPEIQRIGYHVFRDSEERRDPLLRLRSS